MQLIKVKTSKSNFVTTLLIPSEKDTYNITSEMVFFLRIMRMAGFAPLNFSLKPTGRWIVKASSGWQIFSFCFISSLVSIYTFAISMRLVLAKENPLAEHVVKLMQYVGMNSCIISSTCKLYSRTNLLLDYIDAVSQVNDNFAEEYFKKKTQKMLVVMLIAFLAFCCVLTQEVYDDVVEHPGLELETALCDLPFIAFYLLCQWLKGNITFLVWQLESRATAIIERLDELLSENINTWCQPISILECLTSLQEQQTCLRRCARGINSAFGMPLLIIIVFIMLEIIVSMFYLIYDLEYDNELRTFLLNLQWIMILVCWLLFVIEPCHQYAEKDLTITARTSLVLMKLSESKAYGGNWQDEVKMRTFRARQQLFSRTSIEITALDICAVRRSLLGSVAGAVTTYLVILLQVKDV